MVFDDHHLEGSFWRKVQLGVRVISKMSTQEKDRTQVELRTANSVFRGSCGTLL